MFKFGKGLLIYAILYFGHFFAAAVGLNAFGLALFDRLFDDVGGKSRHLIDVVAESFFERLEKYIVHLFPINIAVRLKRP